MQGAIVMMFGVLVATTPILNRAIDRKLAPEVAEDIKLVLALICASGGFLRTAYGRHAATDDVYTPDHIPGRDKADVEDLIFLQERQEHADRMTANANEN